MSNGGSGTLRSGGAIALWIASLACLGWAVVRTFGLEGGSPGVQLIAYTPYAGLAAVLVLAAAAALRRWGAATVALAAVVALAIAVLPRAIPETEPPSPGSSKLTVMSANLRFGEANAEELTDLVRRYEVDALSVQELTPAAAARLDAAGLSELLPHRVVTLGPESLGAGIYARHRLRRLATESLGGGPVGQPQARLGRPGIPALDLVAVHPAPPTTPGKVRRWRQGLRSLPQFDPQGRPTILIGDFNATLDHAELRRLLDSGYVDAAEVAGKGLTPTWRSARLLVPPLAIDHVLVDPRLGVHDVNVDDIARTDHRVVTAELSVVPAGDATPDSSTLSGDPSAAGA